VYKKLNPVVPLYREQLEDFLTRFWYYYGKLLEYKEHLKVLKYPELPLHNNGSELEVRAEKRVDNSETGHRG
jgi:hypothetical protein